MRNEGRTKNKRKKLFLRIAKILFFCFLLFVLSTLLLFVYYTRDLPRPEKFTEKHFIQSTKIYDRTGSVLLYEIYGEEKREVVSISQMPDYLKKAVIAAEDSSFYQHIGLDFRGILRAVFVNLKLWKPVQGGSTITQQLIRSTFLTREKTLDRKIREAVLTLELERRYSKEQILEWYLNQVPFGENSYGAEAASQVYFKKHVSEISLAEAAVLAALIRAPSYYSPYGPNLEGLIARKDYILNKMAQSGYITEEKKQLAQKEKLNFSGISNPIKAPHFSLYIQSYLEEEYGRDFLIEKGLKVYTTINWELQDFVETTVEEISKKNKNYNANNAAVVVINPKNGEILAIVGSKDYFGSSYPEGCESIKKDCLFDPQFNVAILGKRQPGSAFKPFVYATAFKKGYTPNTVLWDVKTEFNPNCDPAGNQEKDQYELSCYHPQDYDGKFRGKVSLRQALGQSLNLPSVKILYLAGIEDSLKTAKDSGITTLTDPNRYGLSLVLGGGEVTLLEMTSAFGVFATEGLKVPPVGILKIEDWEGNIIEENKKEMKRVLDIQTTRLITDILSDNEARTPMFGPNSLLYFKDYQVAAKTGTTQYFNDGWAIGYAPFVAVGVWVGNNNNAPMVKEPGIVLAGPIFNKIMWKILSSHPKEYFNKPNFSPSKNPILDGIIDDPEPHSILHYIDKNNPLEKPEFPETNPQYLLWEIGVKNWISDNPPSN